MMLTDKAIQTIVDDMVVLVDNREKSNEHIIEYLKKEGIKYRVEKLDTADYTFILPHYPELGLDKQFLVERKNSVDEIAGNFGRDRDRFQREFERVTTEHLHLVVEDGSWKKILNGTYRSKLPAKSFMASLLTWSMRYGFKVWFVGKKESPTIIYNLLKYELMENLKKRRDS